ncbi:MAG: FAD binding domain-containing protein [Anaerolineales bacterium]
MKPAPFKYERPLSIEEALELLSNSDGDVKLLAGGQSLVPAMNFRIMQPSVLIDLNRVEGLDYLEQTEEGGLRIGAMTRQAAVEKHPMVAESAPLLNQAMPLIAHPQIRNRGTIGGSMVHADPAAELPVVAVAVGAEFTIQGQTGERTLSAEEFFQGMFTTAVGPDELLVEVHFPPNPEKTGWSFQEIARRHGDYAMAGIAAGVTLDAKGDCKSARLVYLNVGDGPVEAVESARILIGHEDSGELFEEVAHHVTDHVVFPFGNVHATPEYQSHLARVLTVRALSEAWQRAGQR